MHVVPSRLTLYLSQLFSCRSIRLLSVILCCSTPFCGPVLDGPAVGTVTLTRNARQLGVQDLVVARHGNREHVRAASEGDFCSISKPIPAVRGTKEKLSLSYCMLGSLWHGSVGSPCGLFSHGNLSKRVLHYLLSCQRTWLRMKATPLSQAYETTNSIRCPSLHCLPQALQQSCLLHLLASLSRIYEVGLRHVALWRLELASNVLAPMAHRPSPTTPESIITHLISPSPCIQKFLRRSLLMLGSLFAHPPMECHEQVRAGFDACGAPCSFFSKDQKLSQDLGDGKCILS